MNDPVDSIEAAAGRLAPVDTAQVLSRSARLVRGLIASYPRLVPFAWLLVLLLWAGSLALAGVCWFVYLPALWHGTGGRIGPVAGALVGTLFLALIPFWGWMLAYSLSSVLFEATIGSTEKEKIANARERVRETEEDVLRRLEKTDDAGLLPLLRYSRAQLDAYYAMGLGQTRRAFLNAALAMWLGFLLLVAGIALYVGPVEKLGLARPAGDFNVLILASAVIIEVISALFLWVYRSTIGQLTFYFRLQMQGHTAIMCFRIASTMAEPDAAKRAVIDKLLGAGPEPERPEPMTSKGLTALVTGKG
jgi:TRADD-N domain-containing protein